MTYSERLRSPLWQKKRLQILERDGWRCQSCSTAEKSLQVHHIIYRKGVNPWDYPDDSYQTLCEDCHEERQVLVDGLIDSTRMIIKDVPTEKISSVSYLLSDVCLASLNSGEVLAGGIWNDAIHDLCDVQRIERDGETPVNFSRCISSLKNVIEMLEEKQR